MIDGSTGRVRRHVSSQWRSFIHPLTTATTTGFGSIGSGIGIGIGITGRGRGSSSRRRSRSTSSASAAAAAASDVLYSYSTLLDNAPGSFAGTGTGSGSENVDVDNTFGSGISASWAVVPLDDTNTQDSIPGTGTSADTAPAADIIISHSTRNAFSNTTSTSIPNSNSNSHLRMTTNPSHILIARGSRGHNPSAALSSPTETHAAASGIFRNNHRDSRARRLHHSASSRSQSHSQTTTSTYGQGQGQGPGGGGVGIGIGGTMSGQWVIEESEADSSEKEGDEMSDAPSEDVELDPTFTREGRFPGTVKIVVEGTTFWAHREILVFASPFFEAALSGEWSETRNIDEGEGENDGAPSTVSNSTLTLTNNNKSGAGRRHSMASSIITIPQPPSNPRDRATKDVPTGISCSSSSTTGTNSDHEFDENVDEKEDGVGDVDADVDDLKNELDALDCRAGDTSASDLDTEKEKEEEKVRKDQVRDESLSRLEGKKSSASVPNTATARTFTLVETQSQAQTDAIARVKKKKLADAEAKIVLKEEKAAIFHDFLKFVYPHLECSITWNNVEGLMNISSKLCVPALTKQCLTFLLTHAAGKPIKAMRIAELFEEEHLYRESSRFVLDNPGGWSEAELSTLSQETLLKLEKRRNWFLERVLKLGLINVAKEYQCCATCPDPPTCARLLDERWRAAYKSCFRFGPCQPSMVYRYLRGLEGVTPPLQLTHLNCQNHAKAFTTTLFDRMFSLGVRGSGSGADPVPLGARVPGVQGPAPGPRRHFLYCSLNP